MNRINRIETLSGNQLKLMKENLSYSFKEWLFVSLALIIGISIAYVKEFIGLRVFLGLMIFSVLAVLYNVATLQIKLRKVTSRIKDIIKSDNELRVKSYAETLSKTKPVEAEPQLFFSFNGSARCTLIRIEEADEIAELDFESGDVEPDKYLLNKFLKDQSNFIDRVKSTPNLKDIIG